MSTTQLAYIVFGIVLVLALLFDLGLMSKKHATVSIKKALWQTLFWVGLSMVFWAFLWIEKDSYVATKYISAYLMEWSLSIDNIFVFILIFSFFKVNEMDAGRALLVGILLAIVFRVIFIALGIELINRFHWLMYVFGAFLLYTGIKLFIRKEDDEYDPQQSKVYKAVTKLFRITDRQANGKYVIPIQNKWYFTSLAVVVLMLAATDIVFALDSIPTVVTLVRSSAKQAFTPDEVLVIYSSNVFAVLGLRSLFFLLRGAVNRFVYLQQGIAVVLVFIGIKMLIEFFDIHISIYLSLGVIVLCIAGSIVASLLKKQPQA
ncbi:TerC/Alx family metal homeostasis membrane protein [Deminuibacter soli]|uniref:Tellurium resistance protein TerC n=1 Tax=Deminuibacter soli TaxID=2291815 RepID=A0A3E1NP54_9BACT|nr:TerC/Alx family metal homeostasis membrane protein [Deminuibacter soli]RFM29700.1 tellurium resistance protein TerC [Deminuibacter soli]